MKYQKILHKRLQDIEKVIDSHFKLIHISIIQEIKNSFEKKRKKFKKDGITISLQQQAKMEQDEAYELKNSPDVQFFDTDIYTYPKKLTKLIKHADELIVNDINRPENRMGIQEVCRMDEPLQSYFIFDTPSYKIARKFFFAIDPQKEIGDDELIEEMLNARAESAPGVV